ncbi:MAG: 4Fe-4S dicluster domain-containing protein [Clostridia bacterium]|nr:4Fe-4S dicluster domain-containing protein [Clostridia bacterium]
MRKCSLQNLETVFEKISESMTLYIPADTKDGADFTKWTKGVQMSQALNTNRSAKDFFFPQTEDLVEFKTEGKNIEVIDTRKESEDFAVFGVRACDVKSFDILDRVFLTEPYDSYYATRREHGVIFSLACTRPAETCFCGTFGINPAEPGADVSMWKTDSEMFFEANTEKGKEILKKLESVTQSADASDVDGQKKKTGEIMKKLPLSDLSAEKFGKGMTSKYFDSPKWRELSATCIGCGTCTFVCPTCQCYDIKDFNSGKGVIRYRCWDSCMYSDFTKMAHGNSRNSQTERFRQRFMHKLVYYPDNNDGMFSCVGCGRCLNKCPISMNIVKVMKTLGGEDNE